MPRTVPVTSGPILSEESTNPVDRFAPEVGKFASGAAAAMAGAMLEGVGMAGITLLHTKAGVVRAYHDLWTSEHGPVYKGSWSAGIPALAALATPLAGVIGLGLGAYGGAVEGYQHGFNKAMSDCLEGLKQYNQLLGDTLTYEPGGQS
ncbi:hypothetical protein IV102_31815 [bacterium]|nr:hypothetical protein [bacterium]